MKLKFEIESFSLPSSWAPYLINGDAMGLEDEEQRQCDEFVASPPPMGFIA